MLLKQLLLKYRWRLLWLFLIIALFFFFVPSQKKYYLRSGLSKIDTLALHTCFVLAGIIGGIVLVVNFKTLKHFSDILVVLCVGFLICIMLYAVVYPFLKAGYLFGNRLVARQTTTQKIMIGHGWRHFRQNR